MNDIQVKIPVARLARLVAKAVRLSRNGFTKEERQSLGADLLDIAAQLLEDALD